MGTSWLNIRSHKSCSPQFTNMALCDSFPFPKVKIQLKGNRFQNMEKIKKKQDNTAVGFSKESVPKVLQTMEGPLEQMCGVCRGLGYFLSGQIHTQTNRITLYMYNCLSLSLAQKAYYKYFPIINISNTLMHFS
jgi:hypothetical protein